MGDKWIELHSSTTSSNSFRLLIGNSWFRDVLEPFSWILTHWKVQCLPFTCDWNHLSLVWATFTIYRSYIWLCDFMFCNTYNFFQLFMCKVLGLWFFYYKARTYSFIFFGLGLELETNQAFQPLTPPCPPNMPWKDKKWMKVGSKWKCKVGTCIFAYRAKWLLTKHLKEVHGLVAKKDKPGRLSDALLSSLLNALEGPNVFSCGNMELGGTPDLQH